MRRFAPSVVLTACLLLPQLASAQPDPPVGVRAAGMGGAFVAVADDASAVYWNPGGLAAAAYFSIVVDRNTVSTADDVRLLPETGRACSSRWGLRPWV